MRLSDYHPAAPAYGRYWIDAPEGRKRRVISLGSCATRTVAKRKLREFIETEGVNGKDTFITLTTPGMTSVSRQRSGFLRWPSDAAAR
ncbi:MAG: hypothetical protein WB762_31165 [Candidatus Sulfotelmatobacter sp.]